MHTLLALLLFVVVFVVPNQVSAEDGSKEMVDKRQVSVLARDGHLPYEGKRYVGQKKPDSDTQESGYDSINQDLSDTPSVYLQRKRYVGALAKTGDLRFKEGSDKREDVDTMLEKILAGEDPKKARLEALQDELVQQQEEKEEEEVLDGEKRSLSSLARSGAFPLRSDKRSIASMARAGYLRSPYNSLSDENNEKRGIYSVARNGKLATFGKRGGISSVMRNGFSYQKKSYDPDLDYSSAYDKRHVASLARGYNLPYTGKRNIASFARHGWLPNFGYNSKKSDNQEMDYNLDLEVQRNHPFSFGFGESPLDLSDIRRLKGTRYRTPYLSNEMYSSKLGSLFPWRPNQHISRYGKRSFYDDVDDYDDDDLDESSYLQPWQDEHIGIGDDVSGEQESDETLEQKRHLGSLLAHKSFAMRKKKSISPDNMFDEVPPTLTTPSVSWASDENKMGNELHQSQRQKRDAEADFLLTDEYVVPVLQDLDDSEDEDGHSRARGDEQPTRKKRFFAVRGGGKMPGGRLPHVGRSRSNNPNSGRRRH